MRNAFTEELLARRPSRLVLLLIGIVLFGAPAWAQNENETVGFQSHHSFDSGQFGEDIDILNGGLSLTVPLGPSYQVNARLGYQMRLAYDSKIWDSAHYQSNLVDTTEWVMPYNEGPAGFGWSLHMGRIYTERRYMETPPISHYSLFSRTYKWVAPDGSQHDFYFDNRDMQAQPMPHVQTVNGERVFQAIKTTDNSQVLIWGPDNQFCYDPTGATPPSTTQCFQVRTPDGLIYSLWPRVACVDPPSPGNGSNYARIRSEQESFCGWYTTLIEEASVGSRVPPLFSSPSQGSVVTPYPNNVKVSYDTRPGFEHVMSKVQDSQGRLIVVNDCQYAAGACKQTPDVPTTDDAKMQMRHSVAISSIEVPAPGTTLAGAPIDPAKRAIYKFAYSQRDTLRANPDVATPTSPVLTLQQIDYPDYLRAGGVAGPGYSMYMSYGQFSEMSCRTLPVARTAGYQCGNPDASKAAYFYDFDYYFYIARFMSNALQANCWGKCGGGYIAPVPQPTGSSRQMVTKRLQTQAGAAWSPIWTYDRSVSSTTTPSRVKVTDPFGNDTVYRFSASGAPPSGSPSTTGQWPDDGYAPEWDDGTNYEISYYEGSETAGRIVRTEFMEYDADLAPGITDRSKSDLRVKRSRTRYNDDSSKESATSRSDWDGFGHWKTEVETGFDVALPRTTRSEYIGYVTSGAVVDDGGVYDTGRLRMREVSDGYRVLTGCGKMVVEQTFPDHRRNWLP